MEDPSPDLEMAEASTEEDPVDLAGLVAWDPVATVVATLVVT